MRIGVVEDLVGVELGPDVAAVLEQHLLEAVDGVVHGLERDLVDEDVVHGHEELGIRLEDVEHQQAREALGQLLRVTDQRHVQLQHVHDLTLDHPSGLEQ
jgi:hypothetical protein